MEVLAILVARDGCDSMKPDGKRIHACKQCESIVQDAGSYATLAA